MVTVTVGDIVDGQAQDHVEERIYIARDGEVIFYVGKSDRTIEERILEHCGVGRFATLDALGLLITDNLPDSAHWQVDMMTIEDCKPFAEESDREGLDVAGAEIVMIAHYRPCLNAIHNRRPAPLPGKYNRRAVGNGALAALRAATHDTPKPKPSK